MKFCTKCGTQCEDAVNNCPKCGNAFNAAAAPAVVYADPKDHTSEFDAKDISENKIYAMLCYLFGLMGIIVAAICAKESPYVKFHMTWALRITVAMGLSLLLAIIPVLGWIAYAVCEIICFVLLIIGFFQVCKNKAKEPSIVSNLTFLK